MPSGTACQAEGTIDFITRLERWSTSHERALLSIGVAVLFTGMLCQAITAPLWFDEFFTLFVSRLPSNLAMLQAMPADGQPPLQYWLTHGSLQLLGISGLAVRVPELLAAVAAGLITYRSIRFHGAPAQALFGLCMVLGGTLGVAAFTARPYALLFFFTAVTFYCWQHAALAETRRFSSLAGVSVGIAGAILSHHLGIIQVGTFLAAGEAARLFQRRKLDLPVLLAASAGSLPLIITAPLAHQSRQILGLPVQRARSFWARPGPLNLWDYHFIVPILLLIMTGVIISVLPPLKKNGVSTRTPFVPGHEWVAAAALSLLLPVNLLFAVCFTNYFQVKYAIGAGLGAALLASWGIPEIFRRRRNAQVGLAISAIFYLLIKLNLTVLMESHNPVWRASWRANVTNFRPNPVSPLIFRAPGAELIVVANAYDYLPDWWYAPPSTQARLVYLSDTSYAVQQTDFLPELSLTLDRNIVPAPVASYATFTETHRKFLVLRSGKERLNWLPARLRSENWTLRLVSSNDDGQLYEAEKLPVLAR